MKQLENKVFYFLTVFLGIIFLINFIKISSLVSYFPLNDFMDGTSYMGRLALLIKYGYHSFAPNWYNGFYVLQHYAPGWFFFTLPLYWLTESIEISTFISMFLSYLLSLIFFIMLGKEFRISLIKSIAFFLLFYLSPSAFSSFFNLGRLPELLAFTLFIPAFVLIYKNRELNKKFFFLFFLLFSILMLQQSSIVVFFSFLVLGLFFLISWKQRLILSILMIVALLLSLFWLIPFLNDEGTALQYIRGITVANFISFGTIISILFFISFLFFWNGRNRNRRDLIFFLPSLILCFLYATRLVSFIPILDKIWPNSYNLFFTFLTIFFILATRFQNNVYKLVNFSLYLIPLLVLLIHFLYPVNGFDYGDTEYEIISMFENVNDRVLIVSAGERLVSTRSLLAYATHYYNITTPDGWGEFSVQQKLYENVEDTKIVENKSCEEITNNLIDLEIRQIVALSDACRILSDCQYDMVIKKENVCLLKL
ncbi:hypothetical protein HYV89_04420 [Candidatus Woesearchaeota archaeon]|nr:hypothetical protein [Candidatus Woesearchaeota archaeon]